MGIASFLPIYDVNILMKRDGCDRSYMVGIDLKTVFGENAQDKTFTACIP